MQKLTTTLALLFFSVVLLGQATILPPKTAVMPIVIDFYNKKAMENYEPASKSKITMWVIVISIMASGLQSRMICNTYEVQKRKNKELPVK